MNAAGTMMAFSASIFFLLCRFFFVECPAQINFSFTRFDHMAIFCPTWSMYVFSIFYTNALFFLSLKDLNTMF